MKIGPMAGMRALVASLVNVAATRRGLYFSNRPDAAVPAQRVAFGTSGHRGCAFDHSFNEWHVLAISQAICGYRRQQGIDGPLFLGIDTHALSEPACVSALEVMAANSIEVMPATNDEYTPTPVISHTILSCNQGRTTGLADGIVITPSHNPPDSGGFKYNPPNWGRPATSYSGRSRLGARLGGDTRRRPAYGRARLAVPGTSREEDCHVDRLGASIKARTGSIHE